MLYRLFHAGAPYAGWLALILLPLTLCLVIASLLTVGSGVRRAVDGTGVPRWRGILRSLTVVWSGITATAIYIAFLGEIALRPSASDNLTGIWVPVLLGPDTLDTRRLFGFGTLLLMFDSLMMVGTVAVVRPRGAAARFVRQLRGISRRDGDAGSADFCHPDEYRRFKRVDPDGLMLVGAFYGRRKAKGGFTRLGDTFTLSAEDASRGVLTVGAPGSGKSSAVVKPAIADTMAAGNGLIVVDPQGELTPDVVRFAAHTGHVVIVHDPTNPRAPRYNLAGTIRTVTDAQTVAGILVPEGSGANAFWSNTARLLLAGCLLRFDSIGDIVTLLERPQELATALREHDEARNLAKEFLGSFETDRGKLAGNIGATLGASLGGWAARVVRESTAVSDFKVTALLNPKRPVVIVLTCPGRDRDLYAPYLGAVLTKMLLDLDAVGERRDRAGKGAALPRPVRLIIDEFPAMGDMSIIVKQANLVRKRRISIVLACQTLGQLKAVYGPDGTDTLLTGMATQIVFGAADQTTAEYYSRRAGERTVEERDPTTGRRTVRARRLLTPDEIVRPPHSPEGNCFIFTAYAEAQLATYAIILARPTRIYERTDWRKRLATVKRKGIRPHVLRRPRKRKVEEHRAASQHASTEPPDSDQPFLITPLGIDHHQNKARAR